MKGTFATLFTTREEDSLKPGAHWTGLMAANCEHHSHDSLQKVWKCLQRREVHIFVACNFKHIQKKDQQIFW